MSLNRRDFLKSLFALAVALPISPILSTVWAKRIITVSPDGGISLHQAVEMANPGDVIYLDPGTYNYQGTLIIKNGISIDGGSYSRTTINIKDANTCLVYAEAGGGLDNVTVTGNFIDGAKP